MQRTWLHRYRNERRERWGRKKGFSVTSPATFQTLSASSAGFRHFALGELLLQSSHGMGQQPTAPPQSRPLDALAAARELPRWQRAVQSSCSIKWGLVAPHWLTSGKREHGALFSPLFPSRTVLRNSHLYGFLEDTFYKTRQFWWGG